MSPLAALDLGVGVVLGLDAAVVLWRRRFHRVGLLLAAVCATWWLGDLVPLLLFLHRGPMVHLHLSYPTGRLRRWPARLTVVGAYVWAVVEGWRPLPGLTLLAALAVAATAVDTHRRTSGAARRAGWPALAAALLFATVLALGSVNRLADADRDAAVAVAYDLVLAVVATWLTLDLLRGRWTEATVADLVAQLGSAPDSGLEASLRTVLGDPGLTVATGEAVASPGRAATPVLDDGRVVATLLHDPALAEDPELLAGAAEAVRLAVGNQALRDQAAARGEQLREARRRLLDVGDEQRRRLAEEIACGPVARLDAAVAALGPSDLAEGVLEARRQLLGFTQGLGPDAGDDLAVALAASLARFPTWVGLRVDAGPLPPAVARAVWFVCSESVTNAVKHADAGRIDVVVEQDATTVAVWVRDDGRGGADAGGSGLQGLAARVAALGGTLEVRSPQGEGTIVTARMPSGEEPS